MQNEQYDLSVIVCVYNTNVELLHKCLDSISNSISQNLDVVIVNDGSTLDYSALQNQYSNFNWIHTENIGTLSARELGAKSAKADLIFFMDSDDEVTFDYFEGFIKQYKQTNHDIIFNDWAFLTESTRYYCGHNSTANESFECFNEAVLDKFFEKSGYEHSYFVVWNKVFKKELMLNAFEKIKKYNLGKFTFSEDVLMAYFAFSLAKSVSNIHSGFYFYRLHANQQTNANTTQKLRNQIVSNAKTFATIEQNLIETNRIDTYKNNLDKWRTLVANFFYATAKQSKNYDFYYLIKKLYFQTKLSAKTYKADYYYGNHKLLPQNWDEIDNELKCLILNSKTGSTVCVNKSSYTYKRICELNEYLDANINVVDQKNLATDTISKEKHSMKQRILHNDLMYSIGTFLFPKGSKIRKFLKNKL